MSVPPLLRVNYKFYPLGKKDQSADAFPPSEKGRCFREIKGTDIATP